MKYCILETEEEEWNRQPMILKITTMITNSHCNFDIESIAMFLSIVFTFDINIFYDLNRNEKKQIEKYKIDSVSEPKMYH